VSTALDSSVAPGLTEAEARGAALLGGDVGRDEAHLVADRGA